MNKLINLNMFKKARIKLTAWYLLIIMSISISFSGFIYKTVTVEFERRLGSIERRLELQEIGLRPPVGQPPYFLQDLEESRKNVLIILFYTNGVILILSALSGYFLAGKTLLPIEKSLEEQKRFVADASHELKTPLTVLQTTIEVSLRDKKLNLTGAKKVIKSNLEETVRLSKLANDLLNLTRYESGNGNFVLKKINIKKLIEETYRKIKPIVSSKNIKVDLSLKNIYLNANKESIEQLITVLMDNAFKFTPKNGSVSVTTKKDNHYVYISVKDTGIGIAPKDIPNIFDRFYRADQSRSKQEINGFGLGLSMARKIVDLHNGAIEVKSNLNKGSIFTVKLPVNL